MDYELLREHLVITTVVLAIQDVIRAEIIAFFSFQHGSDRVLKMSQKKFCASGPRNGTCQKKRAVKLGTEPADCLTIYLSVFF